MQPVYRSSSTCEVHDRRASHPAEQNRESEHACQCRKTQPNKWIINGMLSKPAASLGIHCYRFFCLQLLARRTAAGRGRGREHELSEWIYSRAHPLCFSLTLLFAPSHNTLNRWQVVCCQWESLRMLDKCFPNARRKMLSSYKTFILSGHFHRGI